MSCQTSLPIPKMISTDHGQSDCPCACVGPDGTVWAVWLHYSEGSLQDTLEIACRKNDSWSDPMRAPGVSGDLYQPACRVYKNGDLLIVWSQQIDADWDLWFVTFNNDQWSLPKRIAKRKGIDFEPKLANTPDGSLVLAWQGWQNDSFDILCSQYDGSLWSTPESVTQSPGNDWLPGLAVDQNGTLSVVWDSYRHGSYDIFLRQKKNDTWGPEILVAGSPAFEAYASVDVDPQGTVWIAYEQRGERWGKDHGLNAPWGKDPKTRRQKAAGEPLLSFSIPKIRCFKNNQIGKPAQPPELPITDPKGAGDRNPIIRTDENGGIWLTTHRGIGTYILKDEVQIDDISYKNFTCYYNGQSWSESIPFHDLPSRLDSRVEPLVLPGKGLLTVFHSDNHHKDEFPFASSHQSRIFSHFISAPKTDIQLANLQPIEIQLSDDQLARAEKENAFIERARQYRTDTNGHTYYLCRGDLHRHTTMSYDGRCDSSIYDLFRYALDAAGLDFVAVTDHAKPPGTEVEYIWWRTQKITDLFNAPPHFIALFGYERSVVFPQGHRNIIEPKRGFRPFASKYKEENETTRQLFDYVRKTGGVTIPHTPATYGGGTDWSVHDDDVDAVVEIYQGARYSYEYEGAPKTQTYSAKRRMSSKVFQPAGMVWNAWKKGCRLGVIASSDHNSTHISYAGVFADERSRQGIVDALRARHTFGATDDVILEFRAGDTLQGDDVAVESIPVFTIKYSGTAPVRELVIIKNFHFVYRTRSDDAALELTWKDPEPDCTLDNAQSIYYVRVEQLDGELAWSSPIWLRIAK